MKSIRLGRSNLYVSHVGFGGIPIQRLSEKDAIAVVKNCLALGINFIDTANGYTTSEERIGKAIVGLREGLILATKSHARTREGIKNDLRLSLKRLGVKSIDLFQFHQVGDKKNLELILDPNGPMAVLEAAKEEGVIKHIGITSHSFDIAKKAVKTGRFETLMFPFNFIANEAAAELIPLAKKHDVGFIAMKPMGGGLLGNAEIAFKFLLQFPDILPIPGIEKREEIEEIIRICDGRSQITAEDRQEIDKLRNELGKKFCRRCDYCQPCTQQIPISTVVTVQSFAKRFPPEQYFSGRIAEAMKKAAECADCGECEERCPYHLPIKEMMNEQIIWYEEKQKSS